MFCSIQVILGSIADPVTRRSWGKQSNGRRILRPEQLSLKRLNPKVRLKVSPTVACTYRLSFVLTSLVKKATYEAGKKKTVGVDDLCLLSKISNEAINDNLRVRFENREIYVG